MQVLCLAPLHQYLLQSCPTVSFYFSPSILCNSTGTHCCLGTYLMVTAATHFCAAQSPTVLRHRTSWKYLLGLRDIFGQLASLVESPCSFWTAPNTCFLCHHCQGQQEAILYSFRGLGRIRLHTEWVPLLCGISSQTVSWFLGEVVLPAFPVSP